MTTELENELEALALESCQKCREFGYPPKVFEDMIRNLGAVQAINRVIDKREPTPGFDRLKRERRLDLSAEALILERPRFHKLFNPDVLEIARKRLEEHGYRLAKLCLECDYRFQGKGWTGIDAHWKSRHEHIMPYKEAWPLIKAEKYKK